MKFLTFIIFPSSCDGLWAVGCAGIIHPSLCGLPPSPPRAALFRLPALHSHSLSHLILLNFFFLIQMSHCCLLLPTRAPSMHEAVVYLLVIRPPSCSSLRLFSLCLSLLSFPPPTSLSLFSVSSPFAHSSSPAYSLLKHRHTHIFMPFLGRQIVFDKL